MARTNMNHITKNKPRRQRGAVFIQMPEVGGPDQEAPVEQGATSEDSDLDCWVPDAAEQQQLREGEAARQAERDAVMTDEASKKYTLRTCPCCPGKGPETRSPEKQELINFIKQNGIDSEVGRGGHSICETFHPQELLNELAIHLANRFFNAQNTEALIRWKIQYLYYHCDL